MRRLVVAVTLLLVLGGILVVRGDVPCGLLETQPACQVALRPGPTEDALELITVDGAPVHPSNGELRLTTIAVDETLGWGEWFEARSSAAIEAVPRTQLYPPGRDRDDVAEQNAILMADSQLTATIAALRQLGYELEGDGARIAGVADDVVTDDLEPGDVIVGIDGAPVREGRDVVAEVRRRQVGETVTLAVTRDGDEREVDATLAAAPDDLERPYLGVFVTTDLDLPVDVSIDAGIIGGPSAGLMFALSIVELLDEEDLVDGAVVAGTGTLDLDGHVGAVGGIRQKVVAAALGVGAPEPATVFLVPSGNLAEARAAPAGGELLLVPVDTLADAVDALEELRAGQIPEAAVATRPVP